MRRIVPALLFSVVLLFAAPVLRSTYYYEDEKLLSTDLIPYASQVFTVITLEGTKTHHRIPVETILRRFESMGVSIESGTDRYVTFIKKSPIDTSPLQSALAEYYARHIPTIAITRIQVTPRSYTQVLPEAYKIKIAPKTYRRNSGVFYIIDENSMKTFFDFDLDATVTLYYAREDLERKEPLTAFNTHSKKETFIQLKAEPFIGMAAGQYRAKQPLKSGRIILERNVEPMPLVMRNKQVVADVKAGAVVIQFAATALQDGAIHDIISIEKADGQRLRAKVTGTNRVEIE